MTQWDVHCITIPHTYSWSRVKFLLVHSSSHARCYFCYLPSMCVSIHAHSKTSMTIKNSARQPGCYSTCTCHIYSLPFTFYYFTFIVLHFSFLKAHFTFHLLHSRSCVFHFTFLMSHFLLSKAFCSFLILTYYCDFLDTSLDLFLWLREDISTPFW